MAAVHDAAPAPHDPFVDLIPEQGVKLTPRHYAYLKIAEGCHNRCSFCIIPKLRGDLVSRSAGEVLREAEKLVRAGVKELLVISQDTSAYGRDIRYAESRWRDRDVAARFLDLTRELGIARGLGAAPLCLPLSACRQGRGADGERQCAPLYRCAVPARFAKSVEGDAPPGRSAKDPRAHHTRGARSAPTSRSARPSSSAFPARRRRIFSCCSTGSMKRNSIASAPSSTSRSEAPTPTILVSSPCRTDVKVNRHKRFMLRQQAISAKKLAAQSRPPLRGHRRRGRPAFGQGPHQGRRAANRRLGPYRYPPPVAGGRHRHGEGGPRRRVRFVGDCGVRRVLSFPPAAKRLIGNPD